MYFEVSDLMGVTSIEELQEDLGNLAERFQYAPDEDSVRTIVEQEVLTVLLRHKSNTKNKTVPRETWKLVTIYRKEMIDCSHVIVICRRTKK